MFYNVLFSYFYINISLYYISKVLIVKNCQRLILTAIFCRYNVVLSMKLKAEINL